MYKASWAQHPERFVIRFTAKEACELKWPITGMTTYSYWKELSTLNIVAYLWKRRKSCG
jgi:hypothetical protein